MDLIRHLSIFDPADAKNVTIIGAGAIGSRIYAALVELGVPNITVYDFDKVEGHNLPNQIFGHADVGEYKIDGLQRWALNKTGEHPAAGGHRFIADRAGVSDIDNHVTFLAVDTMAGRLELGRSFTENLAEGKLGIDVRMASNYGNVYSFLGKEETLKWYDTLTDDETTEVSACGLPISVGTTAELLSNFAVWEYIRHCNDSGRCQKINMFLNPLMITSQPWSDSI